VAEAPLRILELFQPPDGGVPEHVNRLAAGLAARGQHVLVGGPADASVRPLIEAAGVPFAPLPMVGSVPAPREDGASLRAIAGLLRRHRPHVVHVHGQKAALLGRACAARARIPAVYSPHGFVYRSQDARPRRFAHARGRGALAAERLLGRRTALVTACSRDERRAAIEDGIVPPARAVVVHYGVEPDPTAAPDERLAAFRGGGPLLGIVATLREQKGLPVLLDALDELSRRDQPVRFAIVGNGPLEATVRERLRGPLGETTLLLPFQGRVEPYLRALDVFVLPSLWEGLPIAVLEAMAMGLPVIASAVHGTPEAVEEGVTGHLVPASAAGPLADRMLSLAGDAAARERMGRAAREVARARFGMERMVDEVLSAYRRVAASA
jgi:glycosyltransferase involved in cell wall biosynthesis